jgi:hypothetical protein
VFPLAHAWLLKRLVPDLTPAHFLGCVWPDMLYGSPLNHTQSHRSGVLLAAHATGAAFRDFVVGVLTHGSDPHGFDWYSDEQYGPQPPAARGYAFQHGRALAREAAVACGLPEERGWWKAHNIVEMAFERKFYAAEPVLGERLADACADEALLTAIAAPLSDIFGFPAVALAAAMRRFLGIVELRPVTIASLASAYALQVRLKHPDATPDVERIAALIERAEHEIAGDRQRYLDDCVEGVGRMLAAILPFAVS